MNEFALNAIQNGQVLQPDFGKVREFESKFIVNGLPKIVSGEAITACYDNAIIRCAMQNNGLYVWPTFELMEWLDENILPRDQTIEIGAGNGVMSEALNIKATDSYMQSSKFRPKTLGEKQIHSKATASYVALNIPFVPYGFNVERLDAKEAVRKYKPACVFGCYITHKWVQGDTDGNMLGIDEEWILKRNFVKKYIVIGNKKVHQHKRILKQSHEQIKLAGLVVRAEYPSLNRIFVWDK